MVMLTDASAGISLRRVLMAGVLLTMVAALTTLAWFVAVRSGYGDDHLYDHEGGGGGGGGGGDWDRSARLTKAQCRACEASLGSIEWRKPWWDVHLSKTKARWDWAHTDFSSGVSGTHVGGGADDDQARGRIAAAAPSSSSSSSSSPHLTTSTTTAMRHPRGMCGFHKVTPREAREVLRGKAILFVGNSVSRRLMYAVADAMGGKRARVNVLATDVK